MKEQGEWGHANEYRDERPNCEYLLGFAKGRGIEIYLPPDCPLLKFNGEFPLGTVIPHYGVRYGFLSDGFSYQEAKT